MFIRSKKNRIDKNDINLNKAYFINLTGFINLIISHHEVDFVLRICFYLHRIGCFSKVQICFFFNKIRTTFNVGLISS